MYCHMMQDVLYCDLDEAEWYLYLIFIFLFIASSLQ